MSWRELHHDDEKCFWTDTYYSTCEEMEQLYQQFDITVIDHFAQDGLNWKTKYLGIYAVIKRPFFFNTRKDSFIHFSLSEISTK